MLAAGLLITAFATLFMKSSVEAIAELDFNTHCNEIRNVIQNRLEDHARLLTSGAGFFDADEKVSREEWRVFSQRQKIEKQLPGIQGIGFSILIPRSELPAHLQEIRGEGFPKYVVRPEGDREVYSSIIYLEPFSGRNLRAFGFDMLSEPVRREAMEQARDNDSAALSGKVVLVQETDEEVQAGALMYVPVYRKGMPTDSAEQRRAAIYGWVYSPYRMNDLVRGMLSGHNSEKNSHLHLQVFDGAVPSPQGLLYESLPKEKKSVRFTRQIPVDFNGHRWTLRFTQTKSGFVTAEYTKAWLTLAGGTIIMLLLFFLIRSLQNTQAQAQRMAKELTVNFRESEARFRNMADGAPVLLWTSGTDGLCDYFNKPWLDFTGRTMEQELGNGWAEGVHPEDYQRCLDIYLSSFKAQRSFSMEYRLRRADGEYRWLLDDAIPRLNQEGVFFGFIGACADITERKQAEEALLQVQDRLTLAVRAGGVGVWDYDVVNNKLVWDDQMYRLYGITANRFKGAYEAWTAGLHPEDRQRGNEEIQSALRKEKEFDTEFRVLWPDGTIRNIRALAVVQRDSTGKPLHMIGTNWDITVQKRAAEEIRRSSEMVQLLLNSTAEAIYGLNMEGLCTFINAACLKILGYERQEQLLGKNMHDVIHARHEDGSPYDVTQCPIFKAFKEERETHVDGEVLWRRNGTPFPAEYWSYPVRHEGKVLGAVVTFVDITERRKIVKALRESEEKFRIIFENAAVAITFADKEERIVLWNPFTETLLQMNSADLHEKQVRALYPDEEWDKIRLLNIRDKGMIHHLETRMVRKDLSCVDVDISISVLKDAGGKITGSIGIVRDITDRRRAEAALIELTNAKSKFTSTVSHELRSPLASIKAANDLVRDGLLGPVNLEQKEVLDNAKNNIDRLGRLINNVLVYQKIDAGRMTYEILENDINEVILEVVKSTRLFAGARNADFIVELGKDLPKVKFDRDRIIQVFTNIMTNAVKYTESGSIIIRSSFEDDKLHVSVRDFGPGIRSEYFENLFEPFSKLSDNHHGGTGLGLAISKEIILAHHGNMWAESEVGKGVAFHFTLPI